MPRLIFAGTPAFAVPSLQALLDSGHAPVAVYTQPDRPAGRGRHPRPSAVKELASAAGLPVYQPPTLRDATAQAQLAAWQPDLLLVVAYGLLLPPEVLSIPRLGCVNVHASLLPRWRGAAPIYRALLAGDAMSGVCLMQMEAGLDTGPVFVQEPFPIPAGMTGGALHDALAALGAGLLRQHLPALLAATLHPQAQDESQASYAHKITKQDLEMVWERPALELERQVLAAHPHLIARTQLHGQTLRIWQAVTEPQTEAGIPGTVYREDATGIYVATGDAGLRITQLQLPGGNPLSARDFCNARRLLGTRLGA